jgi:hypothetical protein
MRLSVLIAIVQHGIKNGILLEERNQVIPCLMFSVFI